MDAIFSKDISTVIDDIYFKYHLFDKSKPIVITFASHGSLVNLDNAESIHSPWGFDFVKKCNLNIISFSCTKTNSWYRSNKFYTFTKSLYNILGLFPERLGYGGSMGAFGVSAFSNDLNIDRLLLLNPISTLNKKIAPWEKRFQGYANSLNWSHGNYDGADSNSNGFVVFDPLFGLDKKHAHRYKKLIKLKVPGVGHSMPMHLQKMNLLKPIFHKFIDKSLTATEFATLARKRRELAHYYNWMTSEQNTHLTELRKKIILGHKKKAFAKNYSMSEEHIDLLRDAAILLETKDIRKSYELMKIAHELRPSGPFIKKKLDTYSQLINHR